MFIFQKKGWAAVILSCCVLCGCASSAKEVTSSLGTSQTRQPTGSDTTALPPSPPSLPQTPTVTETVTHHTEDLPFSTVYIDDPSLPKGIQQLQKEGKNGTHRYQIIKTYADGILIKEETVTLSRTEPTAQTYLQGTKPWITGHFLYPIPSAITSYYGWRTLRGEKDFHYGIDLRAAVGTSVAATDGGTVIFAGQMSGISASYGNLIMIEHPGGYRSYYAHLSSFAVKAGDQVYQGQIIGKSGSTGNVTGPHLHFEIRKDGVTVNPLKLLESE